MDKFLYFDFVCQHHWQLESESVGTSPFLTTHIIKTDYTPVSLALPFPLISCFSPFLMLLSRLLRTTNVWLDLAYVAFLSWRQNYTWLKRNVNICCQLVTCCVCVSYVLSLWSEVQEQHIITTIYTWNFLHTLKSGIKMAFLFLPHAVKTTV